MCFQPYCLTDSRGFKCSLLTVKASHVPFTFTASKLNSFHQLCSKTSFLHSPYSVWLSLYCIWTPKAHNSSVAAAALTGKSVQSSGGNNSSSSSRVNRHAANNTNEGTVQAGYWLMHPAKGATYSAYCDLAAWHYWGGSGISPADCGPGAADSLPRIWPLHLQGLRYWGAVVKGEPPAPAPREAGFLYGYLQGGRWLCLAWPGGPGCGAGCWGGMHLRWWSWRCSQWF